jgi:hypothetical protein
MSKFKIYQSTTSDPKKLATQSKVVIGGYTTIYLLIMVGLNSNLFISKLYDNGIIIAFILLTLILLTLIIIHVLRKKLKQIKQIGNIEFSKTMIRKEIGDFKTEYLFNAIHKIEVTKHIRALTVFQSNTGYLTYIVKIITNDFYEEQFIVSEISYDSKKKISLLDTIETLKKISNLDISVK